MLHTQRMPQTIINMLIKADSLILPALLYTEGSIKDWQLIQTRCMSVIQIFIPDNLLIHEEANG